MQTLASCSLEYNHLYHRFSYPQPHASQIVVHIFTNYYITHRISVISFNTYHICFNCFWHFLIQYAPVFLTHTPRLAVDFQACSTVHPEVKVHLGRSISCGRVLGTSPRLEYESVGSDGVVWSVRSAESNQV